MKLARLISAAGVALIAVALGAGPAAAHAPRPAGAVFVQTDDPAGNTVVAYTAVPTAACARRAAIAPAAAAVCSAGRSSTISPRRAR